MPGFEQDHVDKEPHPDSARHDEAKAQLKKDLDQFGFALPPSDIHEFNNDKARERLATLLGQIHAQSWAHTPDPYDYNLADEFISILRIDPFEKRDQNQENK